MLDIHPTNISIKLYFLFIMCTFSGIGTVPAVVAMAISIITYHCY